MNVSAIWSRVAALTDEGKAANIIPIPGIASTSPSTIKVAATCHFFSLSSVKVTLWEISFESIEFYL